MITNSIILSLPSNKQITLAQAFGMIAGIVLYPLVYAIICLPLLIGIIIPICSYYLGKSYEQNNVYIVINNFICLLPLGVMPAFVQLLILDRWINHSFFWIVSNSFVNPFLLLVMLDLWINFGRSYSPGSMISPESILSAIIFTSIPFAFFCGLLIGIISSFWLNSGKIRYIISSSITWAVISPLLITVTAILFSIRFSD